MTWTLHLVGQEASETVQRIVTGIVSKVEAEGHVLVSATLGTDEGSKPLDVSGEPLVIPDAAPVQTDPEVETEDEVPTDTAPTL